MSFGGISSLGLVLVTLIIKGKHTQEPPLWDIYGSEGWGFKSLPARHINPSRFPRGILFLAVERAKFDFAVAGT